MFRQLLQARIAARKQISPAGANQPSPGRQPWDASANRSVLQMFKPRRGDTCFEFVRSNYISAIVCGAPTALQKTFEKDYLGLRYPGLPPWAKLCRPLPAGRQATGLDNDIRRATEGLPSRVVTRLHIRNW
jgi:hypothetical protein